MIAVVDTSAIIRLFVPDGPLPDGLETLLRGAESGNHIILAPELMLVEAANVLLKKQRRDELTAAESQEILEIIQSLPIRLSGHSELMAGSLLLAGKYGLTVYDALFLELAQQKGARLYTCDEKLQRIALKLNLA